MAKRYTGKLTDDQVLDIIDALGKRFGEFAHGSVSTSKSTMFGRMADRMAHFYNLPEADPPMPKHMEHAQRVQSDKMRQDHKKLKFRLRENHFRIRSTPMKKTAQLTEWATQAEKFFNSGLQLCEQEYMPQPIQAALADGQIVLAYGILHWCMAEHVWPEVPDPEYIGPDDYEQLPAGEKRDYEPADADEGKATRRYQTTPATRLDTRKRQKAQAGFPWWVEAPSPDAVAFEEDRSLSPGKSKVLIRRQVPLMDYVRQLAAEADKEDVLSPHEVKPELQDYGAADAPAQWEPNAGQWGETVTLYQLWTRDECYEVIGGDHGEKKCVKCFTHPYKMPPFSFAEAIMGPGNDPVLRYQPALEGVYRIKMVFDRILTLLMAQAEQTALPLYYWRAKGTDEPLTDEKGNIVTLSTNSAASTAAPPGYELAKVDFDINPAWIQAVEFIRTELMAAGPDTGAADATTSAQPWTVRLLQSEANVEPSGYIESQARAISVMVRNMLYVHGLPAEEGGFGEPAYTYSVVTGKGNAAKVDPDNIIELRPEWVKSLRVDCDISAVSGQERIALTEHLRTLLNDPKWPITREAVLEQVGDEDPQDTLADYDAELMFETLVKPALERQEVARRYGPKIVLGANGQFIGIDGQVVSPADVLRRNGYQVAPTPQEMAGQQQAPPPMAGTQPQVTMPGTGALQVAGTMPLQGVQ